MDVRKVSYSTVHTKSPHRSQFSFIRMTIQYDMVLKAVKEAVKRFGKIDILVNSKCHEVEETSLPTTTFNFLDAAGNFLCPASSLSANGFKTGLVTCS